MALPLKYYIYKYTIVAEIYITKFGRLCMNMPHFMAQMYVSVECFPMH